METPPRGTPAVPPTAAAPTKGEAPTGGDTGTPAQLNLKVVGADGQEVHFKIKSTTPLKRLMAAYCERQKSSPDSLRFLYDGQRLTNDQTPEGLGMEDGDLIDAMAAQTGGRRRGEALYM
jgi:small ubiquitin-related modifier